jgi:hypothetical protein
MIGYTHALRPEHGKIKLIKARNEVEIWFPFGGRGCVLVNQSQKKGHPATLTRDTVCLWKKHSLYIQHDKQPECRKKIK